MSHDAQSTPDPRAQALASKWSALIKRRFDDSKSLRDRWTKIRKYVDGDEGGDGEKGLVRVNILKSRLDIIQPAVYAKNPEIAVIPDEQVSPDYGAVSAFAETLESVLNKVFVHDAQLKKRGKAAVRAALTTTTGWVKIIYQREYETDPVMQNRIQDTQDNIARIRHLAEDSEDGGEGAQAAIAELEQQLRALEQQAEVVASEGIVIDNVPSEDLLILDDSISSIDDYANASAIAHRVFMDEEKYEITFGRECPKSARRYSSSKDADSAASLSAGNRLVCLWEIWDRDSQTVYTLADGAKEWSRDPYTPPFLGEQFYPFFPLQFERIDGVMVPKSVAEGMVELQDEYNRSHTQFAEHRRESLPTRVYNKNSGMTDGELSAIQNRRANDLIGLSADPTSPLGNQISVLSDPPINPAVYDTSHIMRGFELVSGAQDAAAGSVSTAKTATEAEIMAQGASTRTSERLDTLEDWLTDMAVYSAQLLLQALTPEQARQIAGDSAVWPQMTREEAFRQVRVTIRAGSTAKPNKMRERDQWAMFAQQLTQGIIQIAQFRQQGMTDIAEALRKILDESLKRFDERLTVDAFLPKDSAQPAPETMPSATASHGVDPAGVPSPEQLITMMQQG